MSKIYISVCVILMTILLSFSAINSTIANTGKSHEQSYISKQFNQLRQVIAQNLSEKFPNTDSSLFATSSASMMMTECVAGPGNLGGTAYGDFDYDGVADSGTVGIPNVKVYLFSCDATGASMIADSIITDEFGHYTFSGLTDGDQYRVEFFLPDYLADLKAYTEAGSDGVNNSTSTQMATVPDCSVDAGYAYSEDFCGTNPRMIATCFVNGNPNPVSPPADPADNPAFEKTIVWFNWDNTGSTIEPQELANAGQVGSVLGLAFNRFTSKVYSSAFIKRHVGMGPLGLGGIYEIDVTDFNAPSVTPFVDVAALGVNVGSINSNAGRGLANELNGPSNDASVFDKVAKEGIGAISIDENTNTLYFVNLFDQTLYSLAIDSDNNPGTAPTAADITSYTSPTSPCTNGIWRPFGVNVHRGEVYVGAVCDATSGTASDLEAFVYKLEGTSLSQIAQVDLDYVKGYAANENNCDFNPGWYPWTNTIPASCSGTGLETVVYPTPVLSDLAFDVDGSLILGFMDRTGHQLGYQNWPLAGNNPIISNVSGGDLMRLYNNEGTFVQETNGTAGAITTAGAGNNQGNGGGEFYFMDIFAGPSDNIPFPPHLETSQGDLALFPGSNEVATTASDPYSTLFNSGGINYMNNENGGVRPEGYVLYRSSTSDISTFSKGNGLGGLITVCEPAPQLAGGLVWSDVNSDGIQDGCEAVLSNINVSLYTDAGVLVNTTTTNANGTYSFSGSDLSFNTTYYVVFGESGQFNTTNGSLNGNMYITTQNTGMWLSPDNNDSDAVMTAPGIAGNAFTTYPSIVFTTGTEGWVSNTLDAGFTGTNLNPIAGIGGTIFNDLDGDGIQDGGSEGGVEGVTVTLFDSNDNIIATVMTLADGTYYFPNLPAGDYYVTIDPSTNTSGLNYDLSPTNAGGDDSLDSDFFANTNSTTTFSFDPTNGNLDLDGGLAAPVGSINGSVFNDVNMNALQDGPDGVIVNATVLLYVDGGTIPIQTVVTDASGNYSFPNVPAGNYFIDFDATTNSQGLNGLSGSAMDFGTDDSIDSDADSNAGETNVFSFDPAVNATADFDAGFFQPTGSISGTAFNDVDNDGIQDLNELPIRGVTVTLIDALGAVVQTTTTNPDGTYSFIGVIGGSYSLSFDESTNTEGITDFNPTLMNQGGDDAIDSDINAGGNVPLFTFDPLTNIDFDAGFVRDMTTISGLAFNDVSTDGTRNVGEPGVDGVTVSLFDATGTFITSVITSGGGNYTFTGVLTGSYYVEFDPSTAGLTGVSFSPQDTSGDDTIDSDTNSSGTTALFSVDATNGVPITDIDSGLIFAGGNLMGFAWLDCDNTGTYQAGEARLENVPVSLNGTNTAGSTVSLSTTTDGSGVYSFTDLSEGNYTVTFGYPAFPIGLAYVLENQGNDETIDSDAGIGGISASFNLPSGATIQDYSVGFRDTQAPVFNNAPADQDVSCGDPNFETAPTLTATDNVDTDVQITFVEDMDTSTGDCSGITIIRTWTATDDCGNTTGYTQTLSAIDNTPPAITLINPNLVGVMDGDTLFFQCGDQIPVYGPDDAIATDACDDNPDLTFEDFLITEGDCDENGFYRQMYCGWIATDNCGNSDTLDIYLVISDTTNPVLIGSIPSDITITCEDEIPAIPVITATDNCVDDIVVEYTEIMIGDSCDVLKITRKWTATDECGNMTMDQYNIFIVTPELECVGVPDDVTVPCTDLTEAPTVTLNHNCHNPVVDYDEVIIGNICEDYKIIRSWSVTNDCGQSKNEQYTIDVEVPELEISGVPADITVDCHSIPGAATPSVPVGCYEIDLVYNEVILNTVCEDYQIVRTWTATDECGNVVALSQNIFVLVDELELTGVPADITLSCNDPIPAAAEPQVTSDCYASTVDFGETIIGDICSDYKILRVWVANDFCGNQIMRMQTILVETTELQLMNLPADLTLECDEEVPAPQDPNPISACYDVDLEFTEAILAGDCPNQFTIVRDWAATDECGNLVTHQQLITIEDNTAPVITVDHPDVVGLPSGSTITYDCSEFVNLQNAPVTAIDNCYNQPIDVTFEEVIDYGDCNIDGYIIHMDCCWRAMDPCGNESEYCITVIITDTEAPIISGVPADITINLAQGETVPEPADVTAIDACFDPTLTFVENTDALECGYILTRTWLAEDDCGNTAVQSQIITVTDICDCPNIVVDDVTMTGADCSGNGGSINVQTELSPNIYEFILIPNYGTSNEAGNIVTDLPVGSYLMIVNLPNIPDCDEKIYFDITQEGCSNIVDVEMTDAPLDYCIDESLLNYEGTITFSAFCEDGNSNTVLASNLDENCLTLTPAAGFSGTSIDQICVVNCFNGSSSACDTTYLNITVTPEVVECNLAITEIQTADDLCAIATGSIAFNVTGAEGNLTYSWTGNVSTNAIASGLVGGVYGVTVTDQTTDCWVSESFTINEDQLPPLENGAVNIVDATCFGASDGQILSNTGIEYAVYNSNNIYVGQTPLSGIIAGNYVVAEESGNCTSNLSIVLSESAGINISPLVVEETCATNDGVITLTVGGGDGTYTYFWSPNVSNASLANNLAAGEYAVTVMDGQGCTNVLEGITVGNDCTPCNLEYGVISQNVSCFALANGVVEVVSTNEYNYAWSHDANITTGSAQGLSAGTYTVTISEINGTCEAIETVVLTQPDGILQANSSITAETCTGNDGSISLQVSGGTAPYTYIWSGDVSNTNVATGLAAGTYNVTVNDSNLCSSILTDLVVLEDCTTPVECTDFIAEEGGIATTAICGEQAGYCLDIPFMDVLTYGITLNGEDYSTNLLGCNFDTTLAYNYGILPNQGATGPYSLDNWTINGNDYNGIFNSIPELVAMMNSFDVLSTWTFDTDAQSITGGLTTNVYSGINITQVNTGATGLMELNTSFIPMGTQILMDLGDNEFIFTNGDGCTDTINVSAYCVTTDTAIVTVLLNESGLFCVDLSELPGGNITYEYACNDCENIDFSIDPSGCVQYMGILEGQDIIEIIACDDLGVCDTTYLLVIVPDEFTGTPPLANDDFYQTPVNTPKLLKVTVNDMIMGDIVDFGIQRTPENAQLDTNFDNTIDFTPNENYCGTEVFSYYVCNEVECANAQVTVQVECERPIPVTGFSPNGDGVNEFFVFKGLEQFDENSLKVFNRYGLEIFKADNYLNNWKGNWRGRDLPDGTYFYVLQYGEGESMSGWIHIRR